MNDTRKAAGADAADAAGQGSPRFTAEERAAMKDRAKESKASARRGPRADKADGEADVLAKIAEMAEADRVIAERIHALIKANLPDLSPRTWYGMPAYAKGGDMVCFFQSAQKFKSRYATLGFSDKANLDEGAMWPVYCALTELTAAVEARIVELVWKAASLRRRELSLDELPLDPGAGHAVNAGADAEDPGVAGPAVDAAAVIADLHPPGTVIDRGD